MSEPTVVFRNATLNDLDAIMQVEQSWVEEGRAPREKFIARLERFPQGFLLATIIEQHAEKIIGTITSTPAHYDANDLSNYLTWDMVTNNGYLTENIEVNKCNALYIVSGVIDEAYRGFNIFKPAILKQISIAQELSLRYVVAGAVIPGYKHYTEKHGAIDAYSYCSSRRNHHLIDPLLNMYEGIGFHILDKNHVIPEYFPDDASKNYAALVVHDTFASKN